MNPPRYLTKSRFKLGSECPAKLFYTRKPEYADQKGEDSFLAALADGGYQVGELAKYYFPGGKDIETLDYEDALEQTNALLEQENAIIYEAAFRHGNLFIRADVIVKKGKHIELIEVKAKSCDPATVHTDMTKAPWKPYLEDVAFQKHVITRALPGHKVSAYLMLADKTACCPTDGLNQKFPIIMDEGGRKKVVVSDDLSEADLATRLLCQVKVDEFCESIYQSDGTGEVLELTFADRIQYLADHYQRDEKISMKLTNACGKCEFYCKEGDVGKKSGLRECFQEKLGWGESDFDEDTIFDLWDCRNRPFYLDQGIVKLRDVSEGDINPMPGERPGLSRRERQWLQVQKVIDGDTSVWIDREGLGEEMASWQFPLNFIDFETTMVAIPFNKGRHPYEGVAFQLSHHRVHEHGTVEHANEYINTNRGEFPNYAFLRKLREALCYDEGTIFRYATHENTILNQIYRQLLDDKDPVEDRDELCAFIKSITRSTNDSDETWEGPRKMIDMCELVKRHFYAPSTKGSNSIKQVLPAMLDCSAYLREKYSQPVYGAEGGIRSHNFKDKAWIELDADGGVKDPYKALPRMFTDVPDGIRILSEVHELYDGGAALSAYGRMQYEEMSDYERGELSQALRNYCELDTMAMVMIYEGWREMLG